MTKVARDKKIAVITDTVLHYRLSGKDRHAFQTWLKERGLEHWETAVTLCELLAKLDERETFVMAGLRFSREETSFCLPSPDAYVPAWVAAHLKPRAGEHVPWNRIRDEVLGGVTRERRKEIVEVSSEILDAAGGLVSDLSKGASTMGDQLLEAFPQLWSLFPNGMKTKGEVQKVFRVVGKQPGLQAQLAQAILQWLGVSLNEVQSLDKVKPLMEIDRVKILTLYFIELWKVYIEGKKPDPNDREDYLLLTYAPAVKHILTADKKFADRAKLVCKGTIFDGLVGYVREPFSVEF